MSPHVCQDSPQPHARATYALHPRHALARILRYIFFMCVLCDVLRIMQTYRAAAQKERSCKPCRHAMHPAAGQATTSHNTQAINHELAGSNSGTRAHCRIGAADYPKAGQQGSGASHAASGQVGANVWYTVRKRLSINTREHVRCRFCHAAGQAIAQAMPHRLPKRWEFATAYRVGR